MTCPSVYPDESGYEAELERRATVRGGFGRSGQMEAVLGADPRPGVLPASFWRRAAATLLDFAIEMALQTVFAVLVWVAVEAFLSQSNLNDAAVQEQLEDMILWIFAFAASLGNQVLLQGWTGSTFGKHVLGLTTVGEDGQPLGFKRAVIRYFARWLSFFSFGIGFLSVLWTKRRQTLHDWLAHTLVVKGNQS